MQKKLLHIIFFTFLHGVLYGQTFEDSLNTILRSTQTTDTVYMISLIELANAYRYNKPDTALLLAKEGLKLSQQSDYQTGIGRASRVIGIYYRTKGNLLEATQYLETAIIALQKSHDMEGLGFAYNTLAGIYKNQAKTPLAIEFCQKGITVFEKINNQNGISYITNNLVDIYREQGNYITALEYAHKSLEIGEKSHDKKIIFYSYFTIAEIYYSQKFYDKALIYQIKNLEITKDDAYNLAYAYNDLSKTYLAIQEYDKALLNLKKGFEVAKTIKSTERLADFNITYAQYYRLTNQNILAFKYASEGLILAQEVADMPVISAAAYEKSVAAAKVGKYQEAYESYQVYKISTDSLQNEKKYKESLQKDFAYQQQNQKLEEQKKQVEYEAELEQQKIIRNTFIAGFILMLGLVFAAFWAYRNKQKTNILLAKQKSEIQLALELVKTQQTEITEANNDLNQANEELHQQQEELVMLNEHLETQKHTIEETYGKLKITSEQLNKSLEYASDIQAIILPEKQELKDFFADIFIIYKPRDVVSGDFYWFSRINNAQAVFVLADCTGHGVPGAFMSMLGSTLLHEIINIKQNYDNPALILQHLDINLRYVLKQEKGLNNDGMDISVCFFDKNINSKTTTLNFAGAKSFMYYIENEELIQISGDKIYLGGRGKQSQFTNKVFNFAENTPCYLLTDGIIDQNDEFRNKLGTNLLKETVLQHHNKTMKIQQEHILELLATHQKDAEQRDDISMIGLRMFE